MSGLVRQAESRGLVPEDLDEAIHDQKGVEASEINNGGLDAQLAYLVDRLGIRDATEIVDQVGNGLAKGAK